MAHTQAPRRLTNTVRQIIDKIKNCKQGASHKVNDKQPRVQPTSPPAGPISVPIGGALTDDAHLSAGRA